MLFTDIDDSLLAQSKDPLCLLLFCQLFIEENSDGIFCRRNGQQVLITAEYFVDVIFVVLVVITENSS